MTVEGVDSQACDSPRCLPTASPIARPFLPRPLVAQDDSDDDSASSSKPAAGPYRTDPKGDQLVADAAKKLKSFSFFGGNTKSDRYRNNAADAVDDADD